MYQRGTLAARLAADGCGWTGVRLIEEGTALMSLSVHDEGALWLSLEHDAARLPDEVAARILHQMANLLQAMGRADTDTPWGAPTGPSRMCCPTWHRPSRRRSPVMATGPP